MYNVLFSAYNELIFVQFFNKLHVVNIKKTFVDLPAFQSGSENSVLLIE